MSIAFLRYGSRRCISLLQSRIPSLTSNDSYSKSATSSDEKYIKTFTREEDVDQKRVTVPRNRDLYPANTVTHTGQVYDDDDYRNIRFANSEKLVNRRFAIDLIEKDPVVVCKARGVWSDSGGPLGHPKVYINLDKPTVHICGYSGRKFIQKKYYNESEHGPSITYEEYAAQVRNKEDHAYDAALATPYE